MSFRKAGRGPARGGHGLARVQCRSRARLGPAEPGTRFSWCSVSTPSVSLLGLAVLCLFLTYQTRRHHTAACRGSSIVLASSHCRCRCCSSAFKFGELQQSWNLVFPSLQSPTASVQYLRGLGFQEQSFLLLLLGHRAVLGYSIGEPQQSWNRFLSLCNLIYSSSSYLCGLGFYFKPFENHSRLLLRLPPH